MGRRRRPSRDVRERTYKPLRRRRRLVGALSYLAAVGVHRTPTIERPTLRACSVSPCLRVKGQWLSQESNPNASHPSEVRLKADTT